MIDTEHGSDIHVIVHEHDWFSVELHQDRCSCGEYSWTEGLTIEAADALARAIDLATQRVRSAHQSRQMTFNFTEAAPAGPQHE